MKKVIILLFLLCLGFYVEAKLSKKHTANLDYKAVVEMPCQA